MTKKVILKTEALKKEVPIAGGTLTILKETDLEIKSGESVAIVGASGSGKTTLLGLMAGLDTPSKGRVWVDGQDITAMNEEGRALLRGRCVGFVFQTFQLLNSLTALENAMLPLELRGERAAVRKGRELLERVGLAERSGHYPNQLSGGEQQRVAIARAFACEPQILFADEPTGNLDTATGRMIAELLFALNRERGATLIVVTHDQSLAARANRILHMESGSVS